MDAFDFFYMNWQRNTSVLAGNFSCCRFNHQTTTMKDGVEVPVVIPCDKERIRPMLTALWDRKIRHLNSQPLDQTCLVLWRWISHKRMMLAEDVEEQCEECNLDDPQLNTLSDVVDKYRLLAHGKTAFLENQHVQYELMLNFSAMIRDETATSDEAFSSFIAHLDKWKALQEHPHDLANQQPQAP